MEFGNIFGLSALLALVPFIIIYLIRPRAREKIIPSLMFFINDKKMLRQNAFLRYLLRNLIFFLQLLAIAFLALSVASPLIEMPYSATSKNTVIIVDASASMQTKDGMMARFDNAVSAAKQSLGGKVSIILAENKPVVMLNKGSSSEALSILSRLRPKATPTNLGDAMLLAKDILQKENGNVVVISDFIITEGADIEVAEKDLTASGNTVRLIDVANKADNIGIIEADIKKQETQVKVKNFKQSEEAVTVKLENEGALVNEKKLVLPPNSAETLSFDTLSGISRLYLDVNDGLDVDNSIFINVPFKQKLDVLLVTNSEKSYLKYALESSKVINLEVRNPPTINAFNINHDVVIMQDVDTNEIIPSDIVDLKRYAEKGGNLVIAAQEDIRQIDTKDLLPLTMEDVSAAKTICVDIINQFTKQFEEDKCFTKSRYFKSSAADGAVIASAEGSPVLILKAYGMGKIFYYGIIDKDSDFKTQPAYPIFWIDLVHYLAEIKDLSEFNFRTGSLLAIEKQSVKTPSTTITTGKLMLDEAGIYEFDGKKISANLADERESDINREGKIEQSHKELAAGSEKVETNLEIFLLIAVVTLMLAEILYIKRRGDL